MNTRTLHAILIRFRTSFLAAFPNLTPQDLHRIMAGQSETLLECLQARYGYTRAEAKAAWNDFVFTHVDGRQDEPKAGSRAAARPASDARLWRLLLSDWGRVGPQDILPGAWGRPVRRLQ